MDLSVVQDVKARALVTGSVGHVLASAGTVASVPLLMGSVVTVVSVDRVSVAALLIGSVTTIGSAALLMGSVYIVLDIVSRYRVDNLSNRVSMFFLSFAISLPVESIAADYTISFNGGYLVYNLS
jgi:hypothetical protein